MTDPRHVDKRSPKGDDEQEFWDEAMRRVDDAEPRLRLSLEEAERRMAAAAGEQLPSRTIGDIAARVSGEPVLRGFFRHAHRRAAAAVFLVGMTLFASWLLLSIKDPAEILEEQRTEYQIHILELMNPGSEPEMLNTAIGLVEGQVRSGVAAVSTLADDPKLGDQAIALVGDLNRIVNGDSLHQITEVSVSSPRLEIPTLLDASTTPEERARSFQVLTLQLKNGIAAILLVNDGTNIGAQIAVRRIRRALSN